MLQHLVFTFITDDRPGIVEYLSNIVSTHQGNWLESQLNQLAGKFAGIVKIDVDSEHKQSLQKALEALSDHGYQIAAIEALGNQPKTTDHSTLSIIGPDRKGIVFQVSGALREHQINVLELETRITSAPMSGDPMFEMDAKVHIPTTSNLSSLKDCLEDISHDLGIDIEII
jgi:glycine cleavage system regulatory protein